jgi:hypothetical protein
VRLEDRPLPGIPVTLHRVTPSQSGPLDQQVSGADGSFRFALPPADTAEFEVFFATAEYATVRYFGEPIHRGAAVVDYAVEVFDTASALPGAVRVARRDLVLLRRPRGDGRRTRSSGSTMALTGPSSPRTGCRPGRSRSLPASPISRRARGI